MYFFLLFQHFKNATPLPSSLHVFREIESHGFQTGRGSMDQRPSVWLMMHKNWLTVLGK